MACPSSQDESRRTGLAGYLRKPDADFWLELLRPPPAPGASHVRRRERITRYSLGAATVVGVLYAVSALILAPQQFMPGIIVNLAAAASYGIGMWMASLGRPHAPRAFLIITLVLHVGLLQWLLGNHVLIVVFAPLIGLLARVLIPETRRWARMSCYGVSIALMLGSLVPVFPGVLDFSAAPNWMVMTTRVGNILVSLAAALLLLSTYEREVLRSEAELMDERERSDRLLHAVLPRSIAAQLREREGMIADRHQQVTVLFADIAGFTPWSAGREPEEVIAMLEKIFSRFDMLVASMGVEKIKTIGDAYMVIAGAPMEDRDHTGHIADLALQMLAELDRIRLETGLDIDLRVGIHTGPVIAGVIGSVRFSYDVWGDTVNTASRMESHGLPGRIQVSAEVYERLSGRYRLSERGSISIKGKGTMNTWWLEGPDE